MDENELYVFENIVQLNQMLMGSIDLGNVKW